MSDSDSDDYFRTMSISRSRVTDPDRIEELREAWDALLLSGASGSPFCSYAWSTAWWREFGRSGTAEIYVWESGGEVVAILPLWRSSRGGVLKTLGFLNGPEVAPEQLDVLVQPAYRNEIVSDLARLFRELLPTCDVILLEDTASDGVLAEVWNLLSAEPDRGRSSTRSAPQPGIELADSFDRFLATRGRNLRNNFRRRSRQLRDIVGADSTIYRCMSAQETLAQFDQIWQLHADSFSRTELPDYFSGERVARFHRAALGRLGEQGMVRFVTLGGPTEIVASVYAFIHRRRMYYYQLGFCRKYMKYSPGLVAIGRTIELAFAEGCSYFDFLRGEENYKRAWANAEHATLQLEWHRGGPATRLWQLGKRSRTALGRLKRKIKSGSRRISGSATTSAWRAPSSRSARRNESAPRQARSDVAAPTQAAG